MIWRSPRWAVIRVPPTQPGRQPYLRIENTTVSAHVDYPVRSRRSCDIIYDFPELIPLDVKKAVEAAMPPCTRKEAPE